MGDIIHLLPDSIANQIAAGEVVQRPASVVKELMENSLDAGSDTVKLIVEEAGKKMIQVVDNGNGMSETDVRMAFERHATSKINKIDDLYKISTFGFRGEALASIGAVSRVEIKTKRREDKLGTELVVEGSKLKQHEPCSTKEGTSITVKNLFYNIPARKNFLKSNPVEYRHLMDEFLHVALAQPAKQLVFKNGRENVYYLRPSKLRQRIVNVLGRKYDNALVPVDEESPLIKIKGFIGKPEFARKKRGDQYFFVNNRYIRNPYLNHAVMKAFEELLPSGYFPLYFLYFEISPDRVDVNVHPTKTEIKFEDEKAIYAILRASIKKALSENHIAPSLSFEREEIAPGSEPEAAQREEKIQLNTRNYPGGIKGNRPDLQRGQAKKEDWEELYKVLTIRQEEEKGKEKVSSSLFDEKEEKEEKRPLQIQKKYILTPIRSGFMIVHQHYAHQRILYEGYLKSIEQNQGSTQQQLFPEVIELNQKEHKMVTEVLPEIKALGFNLEPFGKKAFIINGVPADIKVQDVRSLFEKLLEDYQYHLKNEKLEKRDNLARSLAKNAARNVGEIINKEEMRLLIDQLFACQMPYYTPDGKPVFITISQEELDKKFEKGK